jgi:hypothetical protein
MPKVAYVAYIDAHCQGYLFWLRMQSKTDMLYLKQGDLKWTVIDPINEIRVYDHGELAGLQLVDSVAGAFFQAVNGWSAPAITLEPRMARDANGRIFGYGLKLMPDGYMGHARPEQLTVLQHYADQKGGRPLAPDASSV